uniref:Predicted protein n=1 Tax=Hordeum vulgare subsp. vulgare TaxID=112509 RepID=F2E2A7_HORVV|nr:predicted protein [Hordeum vulgare subsp. vulgare]
MEVEDEGDINVRNKAIGFLQEMIENKQSKKLLSQYVQ